MKYTLAITHYNRPDMLVESVSKVNGLLDELIIQDDASDRETQKTIAEVFGGIAKIYFNLANVGMSRNKCEAISNAKNKWVIIFDSDNILYPEYVKAIPKHLERDTIYVPDFAEPNFDYRKFAGEEISAKNLHKFIKDPAFEMLLNTCNYLVHRDEYLKVYQYNSAMKATDTLWFNYLWLRYGGKFKVVPGMRYFHRVHKDSGFMKDVNYNMAQSKIVMKLIESL